MRKTDIQPAFCLGLAAALMIIPLRLMVAWILAAVVHELFHYLAIKLARKQIYQIKIGFNGAVIETEAMSHTQEMFCALAGPLGGLVLMLLAKYFPLLALCGFIQSAFNLLPIFPLDGGRAYRCLLCKLFGTQMAAKIFAISEKTVAALLLFGALLLIIQFHFVSIPVLAIILLLLKTKLSCKQRQ